MAKGCQANKEHLEAISAFGKGIGKRAGFKCEWCEGKEDLSASIYKVGHIYTPIHSSSPERNWRKS